MQTPRGESWFIGLASILLLLGAGWLSARIGLSRLYSEYAIVTASIAAAETAIRLSPTDPQAHFARAAALADREQSDEAIAEFQRAIKLKPRDYYFWLKLARTEDWAGKEREARQSFAAAVQLAPFYAAPRWELGNLLLRAGEPQQAFAELRRAADSNTLLLPAVIDLAWNTFNGDRARIQEAVNSRAPEAQLALARYFSKRGRVNDTLAFLDAAGNEEAAEERQILLSELFYQRRYPEAYQVWLSRPEMRKQKLNSVQGTMTNGGFEGELTLEKEPWFDWHLGNVTETNVKAALDPNHPREGQRSLRLEWAGDPKLTMPILSQVTVVEPNRHYRLSFAARAENLISGGMPYIAVVEKAEPKGMELGQSSLLPRDTKSWREYSIEFTVPPNINAVMIILRRQCNTSPCPIYGRLWLDDFSLQKL